MRNLLPLLTLFTLLPLAVPNAASQAPTATPAPDYANPATWVCRPGKEDLCTTGLDATVIDAEGHKTAQPFTPAVNPPIDCFYVYPTVSLEDTPYADLAAGPEILRVVKSQAARLSARCRVFAPIYRQATLAHLRERMGGGKTFMDSDIPGLDVASAWSYYLQHDNHGRGVVLIGHSQGTILLQELIAKSIDGKPEQALMVSAFLAGDPSLAVPKGKLVGGTFAHIPVCSAAAETGCAYAWGTFLAGETSAPAIFGHARADGLVSACVNPAAPSGGSGALKFYHSKLPTAPAADPPQVETVGQLTGSCIPSAGANIFSVTIEPGPDSAAITQLLKRQEMAPGWGIHPYDVGLVMGNILDVIGAETATWQAKHK